MPQSVKVYGFEFEGNNIYLDLVEKIEIEMKPF